MAEFESSLNTASEDFARNRADMLALVDELDALRERAQALSEKRRPRFEERGQLTPRERLQRLLDPGMPFVELYGLANYLVDSDDRARSIPGASLLTGIGSPVSRGPFFVFGTSAVYASGKCLFGVHSLCPRF